MNSLNLILAAAEGGPNPFAGTIYQSVAAAVIFLALLFLLKKYAWGPILTGLQDRENKIKSDLEAAEKANKDAVATLKEYETKLATARAEADKIIEESRRIAERTSLRLQQETQDEITTMRKRATAEIQYAKEQALREIFTQTAELSSSIAGKILRREINPADQQTIVQESLASLKPEDLN